MSSAAASPAVSRLSAFINHPAGPKTVFFWAPMFKWGLVAAGIKDLSRPADKISVPQNLALTATGLIWVRYSFVIIPVNYSLAGVNCFVAATGIASLYRAWDWTRKSPEEQEAVRAARIVKDAKELEVKSLAENKA